MSQLCLLAIVLCLPLGCLGIEDCMTEIENTGNLPRGDIK